MHSLALSLDCSAHLKLRAQNPCKREPKARCDHTMLPAFYEHAQPEFSQPHRQYGFAVVEDRDASCHSSMR